MVNPPRNRIGHKQSTMDGAALFAQPFFAIALEGCTIRNHLIDFIE